MEHQLQGDKLMAEIIGIEVKMDPVSGMKGLKQIAKALHSRIVQEEINKDEIFERHSQHFLDRCYPDWSNRQNKRGK